LKILGALNNTFDKFPSIFIIIRLYIINQLKNDI